MFVQRSNPDNDREELVKKAKEYFNNKKINLTSFITDYGNFIDEVYKKSKEDEI